MPFPRRPAIAPMRNLFASICVWLMLAGTTVACEVTGSPAITLGSKTSFGVRTADTAAGSGASGLACPGILGLLSSQYIYIGVSAKSNALTHAVTGDTIAFDIATTPGGAPLVVGTTSGNLAAAGLLSGGGTNGDISLFVSLGAASNVASGVYTGTVTLRWHYATCANISALGICVGNWSRSPGINQNTCALGLCTLVQSSLPGMGSPVTLTISLTVTRDCRFDADNIDFGSAPFADSFSPVSGALRITCTKGTTYTVGLGNGGAFSNGRRRMLSGANRLQYDVFRPGNTPWNNTTQRVTQATAAAGSAAETFPYEARIYTDQVTPASGTYTDTLVIDVMF